MRSNPYLFATAAAIVLLASCGRDSLSLSAPAFLAASIDGEIRSEYVGSGTFDIRSADTPDPVRFVILSQGSGASSGEGFWFHSTQAPRVGARPIGMLDPATDRAIYWQDEGNVWRIYRAEEGEIALARVTARRVAGSFHLSARLQYVCAIHPGFPGPIVECEPAQEDAVIQVTGSFAAGPLGGGDPGRIPWQW
jgi:hypothetical protein